MPKRVKRQRNKVASVRRGGGAESGSVRLNYCGHTPPQAHLPKTRRIENVRGAFSVSDPKVISGARVLLVDDVTTTGATANEAARALLAAGASQVVLAVIAKADPPKAYEHAGKDG